MPNRHLTAVLVACGLLATARPRPAAFQEPGQRLTSGAAAIVVDAVVRDSKGKPVTDLRTDDFQLLEDGVPQDIGDVTVVMPGVARRANEAAGGSDKRPEVQPRLAAAPAGPGFLAIVFDRLSPDARPLAYKGALACLDTMQPDDYVGIFLADLTLTTIQPYTNDRERLRAAIKDVASRATSVFDRTAIKDMNRSGSAGDDHASVPVTASPESVGRSVDTRGGGGGRGAPVTADTSSRWEIMARDQQGYATTDALIAIAAALGRLPGRKSVVFFAEGLAIPSAVLPHFRNVVATANRGNVSVYTIDAAGLRVQSKDAETGREVRAMGAAGIEVGADGSNQSNIAMMERNEDVLRKDPRTSLTLLAVQTGGFLVENTNDLAKAFQQIDADRRFHYLLTYPPKNTSFSGEWRSLAVKVPGRRVTIRARSGYLAVRSAPGTPLLASEGPALAALERTPAPADLPLRAAALVFPDGRGTRVVVLASTEAGALRFERDDKAHSYLADFTMLARIVDARGDVVRKASQPYRLSGPAAQLEQAQRGEILFFRQPMVAPGTYTLEVALHDALASRAGVRRVPFVVPETASGSVQVGSLVVVQRAERVPAAERTPDNPLYAGDLLVYPNLGEPMRKSPAGTLTCYVNVVPAAGSAPQATLEVLRDGQAVAQSPLVLSAADASGRIAQLVQLSVETMAAGRYTLRLTVTQGGRREMREAAVQLIN
jgi:VWFA-related protein